MNKPTCRKNGDEHGVYYSTNIFFVIFHYYKIKTKNFNRREYTVFTCSRKYTVFIVKISSYTLHYSHDNISYSF